MTELGDRVADLEHEVAELRRRLAAREAELADALAQQTATAEVLGVINSSPGDLAPVFEAMLDKARGLCGIALASLHLREGATFRAVAARGVAEALADLLRQPYDAPPGSPPARLLASEPIIHITDMAEEAKQRPEAVRARVAAECGMRTVLFVPLRKDTDLLGFITAYRQQVQLFTDKQIALLQNFAAQAVIAMENARLITETREALEQQTATAEVLGVINSSPGDLTPVFDAILEKAHDICGTAYGRFLIRHGEEFRLAAARGEAHFVEAARQLGPMRPHEGSMLTRLIVGDPLFHTPDIRAHDSYRDAPPPLRHFIDTCGTRTVLMLPLRKDGDLLGIITASRAEVRPFTDKQIALLQNFAAQAVIAMENARLITETREALEQQTATAEVLGVINSSPGDLAPVFDAMLEKATRLCGAGFGSLWMYEGEQFRAVAVHAVPTELAEFIREPVPVAGSASLVGIVQGQNLVHVRDLAATELYDAGNPVRRAYVDLGGARSLLSVALRKDNALLGAFNVFRQEVRPFSDKEIALVQNFAAQAVIAMDNARLITETREALEQQTAIAEVLGVINSSPGDLAPVFDAMLEKAMHLCEAAFGVLWMYDGDRLAPAGWRGVPPAFAESLSGVALVPGPGTAAYRFMHGERAVVQNLDLADEEPYRAGEPLRVALVDLAGARSAVHVPLVRENSALGIITIFRQEVRPFSEKQVMLLQHFAAQAVIAMEKARLITETREALEQQTATAEVLGVINSSPGDLAPVFQAMIERATRLCAADFGTLWTFDGERFRPAVGRGHGAAGPDTMPDGLRPDPGVPLGRVIGGENVVHVNDAATDEALQSDPAVRSRIAALGTRSTLVVALRRDDALLGAITASRKRVEPYSEKQIALLQNFAAQAVIAMENARLITETREALEQQTATAEVLQVINSSPGDLAPVFDAILEKAMHLCGAAFGELRTRDAATDFRSAATRGVPAAFAEYRKENAFVAEPGSLGARILAGEPVVHILDLKDEDVYRAGYRNRRALVDLGGARTALVASLRKDEAVLGFIIIYRQEVRAFTDKQIAVLQNFAAQAVIAMENARLLGELRQRTDEVAELNRGLEARVAEQVQELGRVGRLKRFLAPQLAELIVSQGDEKILESHRREIVVVFCDLRGYTAFTETAEPEEVLDFLREYHGVNRRSELDPFRH